MKENIVYFVFAACLIIGVLLIGWGGFWFALGWTKHSIYELIFKFGLNIFFFAVILGVVVITVSIILLSKYEKRTLRER
ncbi:hypothetical protein ACFL42_03725 [Candidatus Omnitrophota bacterium]